MNPNPNPLLEQYQRFTEHNRQWHDLAGRVIPDTEGAWFPYWFETDPENRARVVALVLMPTEGGPERTIESPEEYEAFLTEVRTPNG